VIEVGLWRKNQKGEMEMEATRVDGDDWGDDEGVGGGVENGNINKRISLPLSMVVGRSLDVTD